MNPNGLGGGKREPHIYTQEEAIELRSKNLEKDCAIRELEDKLNSQKEKLDFALSIMKKKQLIEFINKII